MDFKDKIILIRVEYNVPLNSKGKITDNSRITLSIPTLKAILKQKPKQIILMTHLGRPDPENPDNKLKTNILAKELEKLIKRKIVKVDHCGEKALPKPTEAKIIMLENLRFYKEEKEGNVKFAKQLRNLADYYVNESFGTCHRKDASMFAVPKQFPSNKRYLGLLVEEEVKKLTEVFDSKHLTVILGFAKISDKLKIMKKLLKKSDKALIGGAVAFSFLKSEGLEIGKSLCKNPDLAKKILKKYNKKILLPVDFHGMNKGKRMYTDFDKMDKDFCGYDIGPKTVKLFEEELKNSEMVLWNGPLGMFEKKPYDQGTNNIAKTLVKNKIKTIIGGGDTALAIKKSGTSKEFYHISTGGGASLEFIEKGNLPSIKLIKKTIYTHKNS